jgi:hypothetical protein
MEVARAARLAPLLLVALVSLRAQAPPPAAPAAASDPRFDRVVDAAQAKMKMAQGQPDPSSRGTGRWQSLKATERCNLKSRVFDRRLRR